MEAGASFSLFDVYYAKGKDQEEAAVRMREYFYKKDSLMGKLGWKELPAVYNTWWCYEDKFLNQDVCRANAQLGGKAGINNFMLDAGWFGGNDKTHDWYAKRGDWENMNTLDFPDGMVCLRHTVENEGLRFGIWCEIEAVGDHAELANEHPEFLAKRDGKRLGYVCMADSRVREWALQQIGRLVEKFGAKWVKFDFNLDPGYGCDREEHGHGKEDGLYQHYMGYYRFLDELHRRYPDVVWENCSSGGLRLDLGMLKHTHFTFLSDPDYVEHHFQCFWGASSYLHPACCYYFTQSECLGDHNGVKNPITEELSMEKFDYIIRSGMLCNVGFSYRLPDWNERYRERLKELIDFYREISGKYILNGKMYRLYGQAIRGGEGDRWQVYQYSADDGSILLFVFRLTGASEERMIFPELLDEQTDYAVNDYGNAENIQMSGSELRDNGICVTEMEEESSRVICLKPLEKDRRRKEMRKNWKKYTAAASGKT